MELRQGVTIISGNQAADVREEAVDRDVLIYIISTGGQTGREAFFDAVRHALPLDPPVLSYHSWDALSDSLWQGLYSLNVTRVVILWPDASSLKDTSPSDFGLALSVLTDVANGLADPVATVGRPLDVCTYVVQSSD
jgi:hypothetical protein